MHYSMGFSTDQETNYLKRNLQVIKIIGMVYKKKNTPFILLIKDAGIKWPLHIVCV